jgi:hypothetical protein
VPSVTRDGAGTIAREMSEFSDRLAKLRQRVLDAKEFL